MRWKSPLIPPYDVPTFDPDDKTFKMRQGLNALMGIGVGRK